MHILIRAMLLATVLLLASCGGAPTPIPTSSVAPSTAAASPTAETPGGATMPSASATGDIENAGGSGPLVTFTRSGGIAGRTETLVVDGSGTLALLNGDASGQVVSTSQAPQAELDALKAELASAEWQQLAAGKIGQQPADGFAYTVLTGGKQVETYDGVTNPPVLERVLGHLSALWQAAQSGGSAPTQ